MSKKAMSWICALVFLIFIGILDYPFLARIYNEKIQEQAAVRYEKGTGELNISGQEEALEEARAYNRRLADGTGVSLEDAFAEAQAEDKYYDEILDTDDEGIMAVIEIPEIQVQLPVYHGTSEDILQRGAGHLKGSSFPVGGDSTHACISAHRGLPGKEMFTRLDLLSEGDIFYIRVMGEVLAYEICGIETVTPDQVEPLRIRQGEDLVTLITCTPYGINSHRLYVHGRRIPYEEAEKREQQADLGQRAERLWQKYWWVGVTVLLFIWMIWLLYRFNRKGEKYEREKERKV